MLCLGWCQVNVGSNDLSDALAVITICNSQDWSELNCQSMRGCQVWQGQRQVPAPGPCHQDWGLHLARQPPCMHSLGNEEGRCPGWRSVALSAMAYWWAPVSMWSRCWVTRWRKWRGKWTWSRKCWRREMGRLCGASLIALLPRNLTGTCPSDIPLI